MRWILVGLLRKRQPSLRCAATGSSGVFFTTPPWTRVHQRICSSSLEMVELDSSAAAHLHQGVPCCLMVDGVRASEKAIFDTFEGASEVANAARSIDKIG